MSDKPREWWIKPGSDDGMGYRAFDAVHINDQHLYERVVSYFAYKSMEHRFTSTYAHQLEKEIVQLAKERDNARAEHAKLYELVKVNDLDYCKRIAAERDNARADLKDANVQQRQTSDLLSAERAKSAKLVEALKQADQFAMSVEQTTNIGTEKHEWALEYGKCFRRALAEYSPVKSESLGKWCDGCKQMWPTYSSYQQHQCDGLQFTVNDKPSPVKSAIPNEQPRCPHGVLDQQDCFVCVPIPKRTR